MEKKIISAIFAYRLVRLKMEELNVTIFKVWMKGKKERESSRRDTYCRKNFPFT